MIDRRALLCALAFGLPSIPLFAAAQGSARAVRVGYVSGSPEQGADLIASFLRGLRELGYDEGRNLTLERRYEEGKTEALPAMFAQLVRLNPDVIVVPGPETRLRAARQATTTIPLVMIALDFDPLDRDADGQRRIVADDRRSLARNPDLRLSGLVVRITTMLPVPPQAEGVGGIRAVRAAIQRIKATLIVGFEAVDLGHDLAIL